MAGGFEPTADHSHIYLILSSRCLVFGNQLAATIGFLTASFGFTCTGGSAAFIALNQYCKRNGLAYEVRVYEAKGVWVASDQGDFWA